MKAALRTFGTLGVLLFGITFGLTWGAPGFVEDAARDFIQDRIEAETVERIAAMPLPNADGTLGRIAETLLRENERELARWRAALEVWVRTELTAVMAEMGNLDCACRVKYARLVREGIEIHVASLQAVREALTDFMKATYIQVARKVALDLRIFSGSNLVIFALLLAASLLKPRAAAHLLLPGTLLLLSTLGCVYLYLFRQNWFFTVLYDDYMGFGYLGYVVLLFGVLCDIALNRARITSRIVNALLSVAGSAVSVVPC